MNPSISIMWAFATITLIQSVAALSMKKIHEIGDKCTDETNATSEEIKILFNRVVPSNDAERCFLECIYRNVGLIQDGKLSVEGAKKVAAAKYTQPEDLEKAYNLIDVCSKEVSEKEGEKCSIAGSIRACILQHAKNINFFSNN